MKIDSSKIELALNKFNGNRRQAAEYLGISERTLYRYLAKAENIKPKENEAHADKIKIALEKTHGNKSKAAKLLDISPKKLTKLIEELEIEVFYKRVKKSKRYVITCAQNATPIHKPFFKALLNYCEYNNAQLIVIPIRYKNPTSIWSEKAQSDDWWMPELKPYLCDSRFNINKNLVVLADIKTQPTAVNPLSGFESISGEKSAIFAHTKIALTTVPTVTGSYPKILTTTGAVTKHNYTQTKAGKKGEFHHAFAATVVEVKNDEIFHLRQLNSVRDGSFIDLDTEYTSKTVRKAPPAAGLVLGDWHDHAVDPSVISGTFTKQNSIVKMLDPKHIVWHDALDFYSRNHWHEKDPFINLAKHKSNVDDVRAEVKKTFARIKKLNGDRIAIFPYSNHPDALARWIKSADWKTDPRNAEFYLETALVMVRSTKMDGHKSSTVDPFVYWGKKLINEKNFIFLSYDEGYDINGIKVDMHGHLGPNGARGTIRSFAKLGVKNIHGHGHGPGISEGAYRVGTSSYYNQEYNKGPSSWFQTHAVIYANGKRSLINLINGEFTI